MDTGRPDLNAMVKVASIGGDEPTFILRGKDPCAAGAVRAWAALAAIAGVPPATLEGALRQADRMAAWPVKKLPGDDHLEAPERQQLEYEHRRRLWDGGTGQPWRLAEHRGHMPEDPATLLRQLAAEQQGAASFYTARAASFLSEASAAPDKDRSSVYLANQRDAADEAANRATYFLAIATALVAAADALEPAGKSPALTTA